MPEQAQANYEAYVAKHQARMERAHTGRIALMHDGEIVGVHDDDSDAFETGCHRYGLGNFSAVRIGAAPIDLGILAFAFD